MSKNIKSKDSSGKTINKNMKIVKTDEIIKTIKNLDKISLKKPILSVEELDKKKQLEEYERKKTEKSDRSSMIQTSRNIKNILNDDDVEKIKESLPWVEKYRPRKIDNISLDKNIKIQIKKMIEDKDIRNVILEGPSGVGKTSTVRCIAREIFGKYYSNKVLEINASDDRGIKIQNPIDVFNRAYTHIEEDDVGKIPNFKLVILDEADNMTDKAKHNITKFIETNSNGVRFAFTCNSKDNISTAIQSRCHIINYPKLEKNFVIKRLKEICIAESIYSNKTKTEKDKLDAGIFAIAEIADGDLRIAVNTLQLTYDRFGTIDKDNVYSTYDKPHPEQSREIINACIDVDISRANTLITDMIKRGYSVTDIAAGLNIALRQSICNDIPNDIKIKLLEKISYAQYNVSQGLELSNIQARGCIADMCDAMKYFKKNNETVKTVKTVKTIKTVKTK